jgi:hypothetical protein
MRPVLLGAGRRHGCVIHVELARQEAPAIRHFLDLLARRLARTVTRLGVDADQDRRTAGLRRLGGGSVLEAVRRDHAVIVVGRRHHRRRVILRLISGLSLREQVATHFQLNSHSHFGSL